MDMERYKILELKIDGRMYIYRNYYVTVPLNKEWVPETGTVC